VGVIRTAWTRPSCTELGFVEDVTPDDWKIRIPYQGILFKVTTKRSGRRGFLLDELTDADGIVDLVLDLRKLALRICNPDDMSENENSEAD